MIRTSDLDVLRQLWAIQQTITASGRTVNWFNDSRRRQSEAMEILRERDRVNFGPRIVELYGSGYDSTARKRVSRALERLEAAGLVVRAGQFDNLTHVRATPAGVALVEKPK